MPPHFAGSDGGEHIAMLRRMLDAGHLDCPIGRKSQGRLPEDGGLDLMFAAYRVVSVLPFLAIWTALFYAFGRRLLPIMLARLVFNGGSAVAVALNLV